MMNIMRGGALCLASCLILVNLCYAEGSLFGHGTNDSVKTYVVRSGSETITQITTNNRILGYSVTGSANAIVGLYDSGIIFAEGGCLANDMKTVWFPFPKDITTFIVQVNASTTIVTIYYE